MEGFSYTSPSPKVRSTEDEILNWKGNVLAAWQEYKDGVLNTQPVLDLEDESYAILLDRILGSYGGHPMAIAKFPNTEPLIYLLQTEAIEVLKRRGLYFNYYLVDAIGNPQEPSPNPAAIECAGVCEALNLGYEMLLPVVLTPEIDGREFDFFFALRMATIEIRELRNFLQYHLENNFEDDFESFREFLLLLLTQYEDLELPFARNSPNKALPLLTAKYRQAVDLWLVRAKERLANVEEVQVPSKGPVVAFPPTTSESENKVIILAAGQQAIFEILAPFVTPANHAPLKEVLAGRDTASPLFFNGQSKWLVEIFRQSHHKHLILSKKKTLRDWIVRNFCYLNYKTGKPHAFDRDNVHTLLSSRGVLADFQINLSLLDTINKDR